jgi:Rrf2 family protein
MANRSDAVRETLRISARADYAIRATAAIAALPEGQLVTADTLSSAQAIPLRFLLAILNNLRQAGIIESRRGHGGGYWLARHADELTLAEIIAAVDVTPTEKSWTRPPGAPGESPTTTSVHALWSSLRSSLHDVLERTTISDVLTGRQPTLDR